MINKNINKIINEYIHYKLPFISELKINTNNIFLDTNEWRFYPKYIIRYNRTTSLSFINFIFNYFNSKYKIGYKFITRVRINRDSKYKDWFIKIK